MTLTLIPASSVAAIAGMPSAVAGILIITFGRSSRAQSSLACAIVPSVSCARSGETSTDTKPSVAVPLVVVRAQDVGRVRDVGGDEIPVGVAADAPAAVTSRSCAS